MKTNCEYYFDHEHGTTCEHCNLPVDRYGNTEADFIFCCFPDCGCDGARLCMAPDGPSDDSNRANVEGMYQRTDKQAIKAKMETMGISMKINKEENKS